MQNPSLRHCSEYTAQILTVVSNLSSQSGRRLLKRSNRKLSRFCILKRAHLINQLFDNTCQSKSHAKAVRGAEQTVRDPIVGR